jgi:crotonobetainyl-CoA:carnitine CoA-transferase CaiB-like acyl-CoA transferase
MVNGEDGAVVITASEPEDHTGGAWKPDVLMGRVCDVLRETAEPMLRAAIKRSVTGKGQYVDVAIAHLVAGGNVTEKAGSRGSKLVELVRHIDDDDAADDPSPF